MPESSLSEAERARLLYENAGREITQQFDTMASCLTLASGTVAALLALLGGSEIFAARIGPSGKVLPPDLGHIPKLSSVALVVLSLAFPFLVRFFIRSTIAYQNLLRFQKIQRTAWQFLDGMASFSALSARVQVYSTAWRSPEPLRSLMWQNLKYSNFFWVFLVAGVGAV